MGSSQSQIAPEPVRKPSPPTTQKEYTLETLMAACHFQLNDLSPEEQQHLQQKLSGTNIERVVSYEGQRRNLIKDFYCCLYECLQLPETAYNPLELIYNRYKKVFKNPNNGDVCRQGTEPLSKAVFEAYVTLDFWRYRREYTGNQFKESHHAVLTVVENMFKTGIIVIRGNIRRSQPKLYGKNALKMVKFFRAVKYNNVHICSKGEKSLIEATLNFIDHYQFPPAPNPPEWTAESSLQKLENKTLATYKTNTMVIYNELSPQMYKSFSRIDLYNLEKRLRGMGAEKCELELANIVGQFLIQGELPPSARSRLFEMVSDKHSSAGHAPSNSISSQDLNSNSTTLLNNDTLNSSKEDTKDDPPAYDDFVEVERILDN